MKKIDIDAFMRGRRPKPTVCYPLEIQAPAELWGYMGHKTKRVKRDGSVNDESRLISVR